MNISPPSSTITGTNPNSMSSDDVDLEFGADPNNTSSPTPSIITPDHPAFVGCPTAAVQDLFEKCGSNADLLQAFAILLNAKARVSMCMCIYDVFSCLFYELYAMYVLCFIDSLTRTHLLHHCELYSH